MRRDTARVLVAALIGLAAGALAWWVRTHVTGFTDFDQMWTAGRLVVAGHDPYPAFAAGRFPLLYPMPAVVATMPFALLPASLAAAMWTALGFGFLSFGLTRRAWWPLIALASLPAVEAAQLAQWSPILTAAALFPALGWLAVAKPTTGGAIVAAYAPRFLCGRTLAVVALVAAALITASFALAPRWLGEWISAVRSQRHFIPLVLRPGGVVLLAALLAWRRPGGRLIALLAVTPVTGMAYDALPLALVPSSPRGAMAFACATLLAVPWRMVAVGGGDPFMRATAHNAPIYIVCFYLPALVLVLRRSDRHTPACAEEDDPHATG